MISIDLCEGLWGKVSVMDLSSKKILWEGKSGQTAAFPAAASMKIAIIWGLFQTPNVTETVTDGSEYELVFRMKPFRAEYYLVQKKMAGQSEEALKEEISKDMLPEGS